MNKNSTPPLPRLHLGLFGAALAAIFALMVCPLSGRAAAPSFRADFDKLVPADKKLSPDWIESLSARGTPEIIRGSEANYAGMPIGGIGAGQLYLGSDGHLWHWDIFNRSVNTGAAHYAQPMTPASPLEQGFTVQIKQGGKTQTRKLQRGDWNDISFRGEYPIGRVDYADSASPVQVTLEAFSPFVPLNTDDSSLPATIFQFTVRNTSAAPVEATLGGELENGVCINNRSINGVLSNRILREPGLTTLLCSAEKPATPILNRADVVFENWSKEHYEGWEVEGSAFGGGPVEKSKIPPYMGDVGGGKGRVVNSHAAAPGGSVRVKDDATGRLVSREFVIERDFITLWVGGGSGRANPGFGVTLFVEGKPVQTVVGQNTNKRQNKNKMTLQRLDVRAYAGKKARIEIVDNATGSFGNIGVGAITFVDQPAPGELSELPDFGTMALSLVGETADETSPDATAPFPKKLSGSLGRRLTLAPGKSATVTFVLSWHFPNLSLTGGNGALKNYGRFYATRFPSAQAVARYIATDFNRLAGQTRLWRDTWYHSTLPFWFLDRTMLNTSTLATSTCYRLGNGRFYGWEGVQSCPGTCGHVYLYAQAAAHLFPDLERDVRDRVDFGLAQQADGSIHFRGEFNKTPAVDAQAGYVLRALREHQMSVDDQFLRRNWPKIKLAAQWLIAKDGNNDGLIEGNQHNTLDSDWFGPVAWLSGLYQASLVAVAEMADMTGDAEFSRQCRAIAETGRQEFVARLFEGGYFINRVDPAHLDAINSGTGCAIDQVFGQNWAFMLGLPRVLPQKETVSALKSLWRYNFVPDVGPYREVYKPGRWYAMPGESGMLMCSFPRSDWDYEQAKGKGVHGGYFNECMNGFEHQVAGHMIWEGMVQEGLAVERAVHDRYNASKRNPWNEIEAGDHYARSMASYGVYLAACGFKYDGPKGHIGFAPKLTPENFKGTFTGAEGWGSYEQRIAGSALTAKLEVKWGQLRLRSLSLATTAKPGTVAVKVGGQTIAATLSAAEGQSVLLTFDQDVRLAAGESLEVSLR